MRQLLRTGRRRYALALFVIPASLVLMGNQCEPLTKEPMKPELPISGLTIDPTSHDFGNVVEEDSSEPKEFTVTNHGPDTTGALDVAVEGGHPTDFPEGPESCSGVELEPDETCAVEMAFMPKTVGPLTTNLVVKDTQDPDNSATATLTGTGLSGG